MPLAGSGFQTKPARTKNSESGESNDTIRKDPLQIREMQLIMKTILFAIYLLLILVAPSSCSTAASSWKKGNNAQMSEATHASATVASSAPPSDTTSNVQSNLSRIRRQGRHLQEFDYDFGGIDFSSDEIGAAEFGFLAGILFIVVLAILLCCCCCGGRGGCSLWDLVAIVCLWEMCCDRDDGVGNFVLV